MMIDRWIAEATECDFKVALEVKKPKSWLKDVYKRQVLASILFGGLYILYLYIPTGSQMAVKELYKMLPYVVTRCV